MPIDFTSTDTAFGVFVGLGLSAAAGLRIFIPLLVASAASLTGHLELASGFDWIGTTPALVGFAVWIDRLAGIGSESAGGAA